MENRERQRFEAHVEILQPEIKREALLYDRQWLQFTSVPPDHFLLHGIEQSGRNWYEAGRIEEPRGVPDVDVLGIR